VYVGKNTILFVLEADVESKDFANIVFTDHDYLKQNNWCLNEYAENVITYISGYVAKTVFKKINCFFCKQLLISSEIQKEIDTCKLLQRKNRNGLCQVSSDVIVICKIAEKTVRRNKDKLFTTKNILHILICQSLHSLPSHIFNISDIMHVTHISDKTSLFDHRSQMIRLILNTFFNLRLKHKTTTFDNSIQRIRMRNNKLTLFQNQ